MCNQLVSLDDAIDSITSNLYDAAYSVVGKSLRYFADHSKNQPIACKNEWFNNECSAARREFRFACAKYKRTKSAADLYDVKRLRRTYRCVLKNAKVAFNCKQKRHLHELSKSNPQKFWSEIKKMKGSNNRESKVSVDDFLSYFKQLFSNDNIFVNDNVEDDLTECSRADINIDSLDCEINIDEVKSAIGSLKRGTSGGLDKLIPELFIDCIDSLSPVLCKLFNYIFTKGNYPTEWNKSIIVPVPKKGDMNDVNNYRGKALTSIFF